MTVGDRKHAGQDPDSGAAEGQTRRLPLAGVRILSLEQYGAGPYGSMHLAQLGAEVIKIEDPASGGDVGRYVPPYAEDGDSLFFQTFNAGKKSIVLDMSSASGREIFHDLVRVSDAVYSNLRGDVPQKIRITYPDLSPINPAIVCCSLSGFGMDGPRRAEPGYDYVIQALAGWMDLTGDPAGPPTKSGLSVVDFSTGIAAALALVCGVYAARRDGIGCDCDVSLFDTAISMLSYQAVWHLNAGYTASRTKNSAHPSVVPFQVFQAADGWFVVACPKDKFFHRLAEAIDRPDLAGDSRYATMAARHENATELVEILSRRFGEASVSAWIQRLSAAGVPCGPVNTMTDALRDPQVAARGMVRQATHQRFGELQILCTPVKVGTAAELSRAAPSIGQHTNEVLTEVLGYGTEQLQQAQAAGAFGAGRG